MRATLSPLDPAQLDKVTDHHKHYVNPPRDQFLAEGVNAFEEMQYKKKQKQVETLKPSEPTPARVVGYLNRFQGCLLPYTNKEQSRKLMRFHIQSRSYQFKALPFGLSTTPMEFTVITKEVKLMAIHWGLKIHQYLDD